MPSPARAPNRIRPVGRTFGTASAPRDASPLYLRRKSSGNEAPFFWARREPASPPSANRSPQRCIRERRKTHRQGRRNGRDLRPKSRPENPHPNGRDLPNSLKLRPSLAVLENL